MSRLLLGLDIAVKVALVALLVHAVANPDLPQYAGKAMLGRALTFPLAAVVVPLGWLLVGRPRPYHVVIDLLITLPFLIDVAGNALDLYDSVEWWDDLNHFLNWGLVTAAVALLLRRTDLSWQARLGLSIGFAATAAIAWEVAEYVTFIAASDELVTAYTDTLGDLVLGLLGGTVGAVLVEVTGRRRPASTPPPGTRIK